jgi:hypothetical protein
MTLGFEAAIKVLEEHIEILKQNLLFLMAEHKPENLTQIIAVKRELDKAIQEKIEVKSGLLSSSSCYLFLITTKRTLE